MKISFSRDYGTVKVSFDVENEEINVQKCRKLKKLHESEEWLTLVEMMMDAERCYDEAVMKVKPTLVSERETAMYAARKNGFCEAMGLLRKTVDAYDEYLKELKEEINRQAAQILHREEEIVVNE